MTHHGLLFMIGYQARCGSSVSMTKNNVKEIRLGTSQFGYQER